VRTIVVGGSASNVGKTTLAVELIRAATRAGRCVAIKVSVREARGSLNVRTFEPGDDNEHRKDSARLLSAGAEAVVWVTVSRDAVRDGIAAGLRYARRYRPDALVIESTSAGIEMRAPSESYFVAGAGEWKPWAERHRARASHVLRSADVLAAS
jgi:molybdopterin-guanine dinucleotide biosynthesis protein